MKKSVSAALSMLLMLILFSSCTILHRHRLGEWQFNGSDHFKECPCGYKLFQSGSDHIDADRDEGCDMCRVSMKYEINTLRDLSWYLLHYYDRNHYAYLQESNMQAHSIHDMNFKSTVTYHEKMTRVMFDEPYFNEYLTALPMHEEYIKSNTEYYAYYQASGYSQTDVPAKHYSFRTQETIRYGASDQACDYERFTETKSNFREVNDFYETTSSVRLTKTVYPDSALYEGDSLSFKNEILHSVGNDISHLIRYYLSVEQNEHGELILPEDTYFDGIDIKTEQDVVYFRIVKRDGNTFWGEDIRYDINGTIDLQTHRLSYNVKESDYMDGVLMSYVDYDYDLSLTNESIDIVFDTSGDFEEVYTEHH